MQYDKLYHFQTTARTFVTKGDNLTTPALQALKTVLEASDRSERLSLYDTWVKTWTETVESKQLVLNASQLTSLEQDYLYNHLVTQMHEDILEKIGEITKEGNKYYLQITGLRYKEKVSI